MHDPRYYVDIIDRANHSILFVNSFDDLVDAIMWVKDVVHGFESALPPRSVAGHIVRQGSDMGTFGMGTWKRGGVRTEFRRLV